MQSPRKVFRILFTTVTFALIWATSLGANEARAAAPTKCAMSCCRESATGGAPGCAAVGDPIHVVTGNSYQREVDLPALPGVLGLEVVRHYNSIHSDSAMGHKGILGLGWRLGYEMLLKRQGRILTIEQPDGAVFNWTQGVLDPNRFVPEDAGQGAVTPWLDGKPVKLTANQTQGQWVYVWRQLDGRELHFDARGKLQSIHAATGEVLTLQYNAQGLLAQVTDPQGRRLELAYHQSGSWGGVARIHSPVGTFRYGYGDSQRLSADTPAQQWARLVSVKRPFEPELESQAKPASAADGMRAAPQPVTRLYHYEDARHPTLLTGISLRTATHGATQAEEQRLNTWAYDANGLATMSVRGEPARFQTDAKGKMIEPRQLVAGTGIEQIDIDRTGKPGHITVTNSLGQKTFFTHALVAQAPKLLEVRGAPCAGCPGPNLRWAYDKAGRITETTQITASGVPVQTQRHQLDHLGRPIQLSRINYQSGQAQAPQVLVSYAYANEHTAEPSRIIRPSRIAGKQHTIDISYNTFGQPTQVRESGYSPLNDQGQPSPEGTAIARTTTYKYTQTPATPHAPSRSLLAEIDGPLPNGAQASPSDSDITRYTWDQGELHAAHHRAPGNFLTQITRPGDLRTTYTYATQNRTRPQGERSDYRGDTNLAQALQPGSNSTAPEVDDPTMRLIQVQNNHGMTSRYNHHLSGQLLAHEQRQGNAFVGGTAWRYDAQGRAIERFNLIPNPQEPNGYTRQAQSLQHFDVANRLVWQADRFGVLKSATYDTEGHLLKSQVLGSGLEQQEGYSYNAQGQLESVIDATGAKRHLMYNPAGQIIAQVDPLGRVTTYQPDEAQHAMQVTQAANTGKPLTVHYRTSATGQLNSLTAQSSDGTKESPQRKATTHFLQDDFEREVMVSSSDTGHLVKRYNETNQLTQVQDAQGVITRLSYDQSGRLAQRSVTAGDKKQAEQVTQYIYKGILLVEVRDSTQTERYAYDDQNRVISRAVILQIGEKPITSTIRYRYNDQGHLAAQTLPDGSELIYQRNNQGQIIALQRQAGAWAPFGWGRITLVDKLESDFIGLRHAVFGNGVQGQWQRSREGVLARVVYKPNTAPAQTTMASTTGISPALWDDRLLFDAAGNIISRSQFASSQVAQLSQVDYGYDGLNQLMQATLKRQIEKADDGVNKKTIADPAHPGATVWRYHHDSLGNRLLAQQMQAHTEMGQTAAMSYHPNGNRSAEVAMNELGQPKQSAAPPHSHDYQWDAMGRLVGITTQGQPLVRYAYNHRGERVSKQLAGNTTQASVHYLYNERRQRLAELNSEGRITRQYIWLADQLIALIDTPSAKSVSGSTHWWSGLTHSTATLWNGITGTNEQINYVHTNHLNAPVFMTNQQAKAVWSAQYAPFGKRLEGSLQTTTLDLRLPGQWEDAETGLHYNDHRYYDPEKGRYLSPDPLGLQGGLNAYAYVQNNPLGFSDPLGLILFAFDGTGNNSNPNSKNIDRTNIYWMNKLYDTSAEGQDATYYQRGVGTDPTAFKWSTTLQQAIATEGHKLVKGQLDALKDYVNTLSNPNEEIIIDIIGFSRGAAQARDFANKVIANYNDGQYGNHCFKFRFMGLFDTVSQFGVNGARDGEYDFDIAPEWQSVSQAYALNEHRALFPLRSINRGTERAFVGAHSDIGGGYMIDSEKHKGDLSDVALNWMIEQATSAGVKFTPTPQEQRIITNPVLHDQRNTSWPYGQRADRQTPLGDTRADESRTIPADERKVILPNGQRITQPAFALNDPKWGPMLEGLIQRPEGWTTRTDNCAGQVNMVEYRKWLKNNHGLDLPAAPNEGTTQPCQP